MSFLKILIGICAWCMVMPPSAAQTPAHVPGVVLASLTPGHHPPALVRRFTLETGLLMRIDRQIAPALGIWRFTADPEAEAVLLEWLKKQPEVRKAQFDLLLQDRAELPPPLALPDDPLFALQWQYLNNGASGGLVDADLDAPEAWEITTGGLSPAGDTIVIAVIDRGVEQSHPDLTANLWRNWQEIPGDGLDNDDNGFIDDYRGWNVHQNNDQITGQTTVHGTPVCGIVGGRGNNTLGITGVNWHVKIMFVSARTQLQSDILAAFDYVLTNRKLYNASNGDKGAFIVGLNCSWGVDNAFPDDAPLWCAAYDSLGAAGVLSAGATANNPVNVDIAGDLPTTCPSPFLIGVTSLTRQNLLASNAGWGSTHVDLGAFGAEIFTLVSGNSYGTFTGTSAATPHVTGAVGLLYAAPCPNLIALAQAAPAEAALWCRELILSNTQPVNALEGLSATGGRLNLQQTLEGYQFGCATCSTPFSLEGTGENGGLNLSWTALANHQTVQLRFRAVGSPSWVYVLDAGTSPYWVGNLPDCTDYEVAVRAICADGDTSEWSMTHLITTAGCCVPPEITSVNTTAYQAQLTWAHTPAASGYTISWSLEGTTQWESIALEANTLSVVLENLEPCQTYQFIIAALCHDSLVAPGNFYSFHTQGCGICTDGGYCNASGGVNTEEWIKSVAIGLWSNDSGNGGGGYENFTGMDNPLVLHNDEVLFVTLTPGFAGPAYKEYFRVYIDYNADGDFNDINELAFDPLFGSQSPVSGWITVPPYALTAQGLVRMRVMMKYNGGLNNPPPTPCEVFQFGQVEDYCVMLEADVVATEDTDLLAAEKWHLMPNPATDRLLIRWENPVAGMAAVSVLDISGAVLWQETVVPGTRSIEIPVARLPAGYYITVVKEETGLSRKSWIKR